MNKSLICHLKCSPSHECQIKELKAVAATRARNVTFVQEVQASSAAVARTAANTNIWDRNPLNQRHEHLYIRHYGMELHQNTNGHQTIVEFLH